MYVMFFGFKNLSQNFHLSKLDSSREIQVLPHSYGRKDISNYSVDLLLKKKWCLDSVYLKLKADGRTYILKKLSV